MIKNKLLNLNLFFCGIIALTSCGEKNPLVKTHVDKEESAKKSAPVGPYTSGQNDLEPGERLLNKVQERLKTYVKVSTNYTDDKIAEKITYINRALSDNIDLNLSFNTDDISSTAYPLILNSNDEETIAEEQKIIKQFVLIHIFASYANESLSFEFYKDDLAAFKELFDRHFSQKPLVDQYILEPYLNGLKKDKSKTEQNLITSNAKIFNIDLK